MKLYLVTASSQYYPLSGAGDWKKLTTDRDEAVTLANEENAKAEAFDDYYTVIEIDTDTLEWKEAS